MMQAQTPLDSDREPLPPGWAEFRSKNQSLIVPMPGGRRAIFDGGFYRTGDPDEIKLLRYAVRNEARGTRTITEVARPPAPLQQPVVSATLLPPPVAETTPLHGTIDLKFSGYKAFQVYLTGQTWSDISTMIRDHLLEHAPHNAGHTAAALLTVQEDDDAGNSPAEMDDSAGESDPELSGAVTRGAPVGKPVKTAPLLVQTPLMNATSVAEAVSGR